MGGNVKGDQKVGRTLYVDRRVVEGYTTKTITSPEQLNKNSAKWQSISSDAEDNVILPDATELQNGWQVVVRNGGSATITVQTYNATTPINLQEILSGRAYEFTLIDNSTAAGGWHINFLEDSEKVVSDRFVKTFNGTSDWGTAVGGYYVITISAATHQRGTQPGLAGVFELSGSDYVEVQLGTGGFIVANDGTVTIKVPEVPDLRFAGNIILV